MTSSLPSRFTRLRSRRVLVGVAVLLLVVIALGVVLQRSTADSRWEKAMALLPHDSVRATFTDWSAIATAVKADDASSNELGEFIDAAYEADLSRTSALESSAQALADTFGLDLREADFEAYGQAPDSSVAVLAMNDDVDLDDVAKELESLGYQESDDVANNFVGSAELVTRISPELTPVQTNVALVPSAGLVAMSDNPITTEAWLELQAGDRPDLRERVASLAEQAEGLVSALTLVGDQACAELAMSSASEADQDAAAQLVASAGGVTPVSGFLAGAADDGQVRLVLAFESEEQARDNLDARTALASGPAPGLGGDYADRLELVRVVADGEVVALSIRPAEDGVALLSLLTNGPNLIATC